MTTLAANTSATITLDGDDVLTTDGNATFQITPTSGGKGEGYLTGHQTLGPYGQYVTIVLTSINNPITYSQASDVSESEIARYGKDASGNITSLVSGDSIFNLWPKANTLVIAGDSLALANSVTSLDNFATIQSSGAFAMANALAGQRFAVLGNTAVGGKTAAQVLTEQIPSVLALAPKYCYLSVGVNDLYGDGVTGAVAYERVVEVLEELMSNGIIPIWSTVWARSASAGITDDHIWCNDLLRQYAASQYCGIFFDGYRVTQTPGSATFGIKSGWTYDASPAIHVNNVGAYWVGKSLFKALDALVPKTPGFANGPEDQTNSTGNKSNVLVNPFFAGTGGTVSANCTGTMPDSWTIDWATRTGTGSAAASIVDVTDPDTGVAIAKGIQVVLSGTIAANDVLRITQASGFNTAMVGGDLMSCEGVVTLTSPVEILQPYLRVQANGNESTGWGTNAPAASGGGSYAAYPESATFFLRSQKLAVLGTGAPSAARYDLRMTFSGAATGTIILSQPRVRVG